MSIIETIGKDRINAMREKNAPIKAITQIVAAKFKNEEIALKRPVTEEEAQAIVRKELKQTEDSLHDAKTAGRDTEEYSTQMAYLAALLPAAMQPAEIAQTVEAAAAGLGSVSKGEVMKAVMPLLKGKADGKDISAAVDAYLSSIQ
ncbi:GatB/YqeY domain-containing protein [Ruminococcaceae bacterium OttesenSCG-928-A16]|nr:GatB/YqeY domain-containing protein [Ruminococcaceae bacterium OttesenSCG-928-A16]